MVAVDAANALGKPVVVFFVSGHGFSRADPDNDTTALATTVAPTRASHAVEDSV
jgi:hypothetical protein